MIDQHLDEEVTLVARQADVELRVVRQKGRHHVAHHEMFGQRRIMDAADAGKIGLHEVHGILPAGGGEIAHGIEAAIDRVGALMRRCPGLGEPALLFRRNRENVSDADILPVQDGHALQGVGHALANMMDVGKLLGHRQQRPEHDAHGLALAFVLVDEVVGEGIRFQVCGDPREGGIAHMVCGAADAPVERRAGKTERFGGAEDRSSRHEFTP
jgi:hypothetical protein